MANSETNSSGSLTDISFAGEGGCLDCSESINKTPRIVPVYNGKVLDINSEMVSRSLSGISFKHYDGDCVEPRRNFGSELSLHGEDYFFDLGETTFDEDDFTKKSSKTVSFTSRFCYVPRSHDKDAELEIVPEDESVSENTPPCVLDRIHCRNSFWDIHRPELCKLTWPQIYVGEAVITEHLHRHLFHHGEICAGFHYHEDMLVMLNKELDYYDKLKVLQPPKEVPPDEKPFDVLGVQKTRKTGPCRPVVTSALVPVNWKDESDLERYQSLHVSKEEFCITIGKPIRRPVVRDVHLPEPEQLWLPCEETEDYGKYREYPYTEYSDKGEYDSCEGEVEGSNGEEVESAPETVPQQPIGWVEPDFCAMI